MNGFAADIRRFLGLSSYELPGMMTNADGSADLCFDKEAPALLESTSWFRGETL